MTMIYRVKGYYFINLQQAMVMAKNHVKDKVARKYITSTVTGEWRNDNNGLKYVAKWEASFRSGKFYSASCKVTFIGVDENKCFDILNEKEQNKM